MRPHSGAGASPECERMPRTRFRRTTPRRTIAAAGPEQTTRGRSFRLHDDAVVYEHVEVADLPREPDFVRDDDHGHPRHGERTHHAEHLRRAGSSADVGSSKSITLGSTLSALAIATCCC